MVARNVLQIGPTNGKGGMSAMIRNLQRNEPEGYKLHSVNTHSDYGLFSKIFVMLEAKLKISRFIKMNEIHAVHVHLTHGFSWFRKMWLIRFVEKKGVPVVLHVHSGKFDEFCSGFLKTHVRKNLGKKQRKVILLEKRWADKLAEVIPEDTRVVRNFVIPRFVKLGIPQGKIRLLHMSRNSRIKGHDFSIKVLKELIDLGFDAELDLTGIRDGEIVTHLPVNFHGWLGEKEKNNLILRADFLLSPSQFEGSSVSIIESLVSGLPVIASTASSETVGEKLTLRLDDARLWAEKISQLSNPREYMEIRQYCIEKSKMYCKEVARVEWKNIYDSMIQ